MGDELGGSVLEQEGTVAETPEDADAGEAGIAGGEDVDIAVAYIDGVVLRDTELTHR